MRARLYGAPDLLLQELDKQIAAEEFVDETEPVALRELRRTVPKKTGELKDSLRVQRINRFVSRVGSDLPRAGIIDKGGTIKGKRGRLAIPLRAGLPPPRTLAEPLFLLPGTNVLARQNGSEAEPMYVLVRRVQIPASKFVKRGADPTRKEAGVRSVKLLKRQSKRATDTHNRKAPKP